MESITVDLGARSYPIHIGPGILDEIGKILRALIGLEKILVITDGNVRDLYAGRVLELLKVAGFDAHLAAIPPGEPSKTLKEAERLYYIALDYGLDRNSAVIALGGGVVGDLAGFVAATYMRGIRYVQVPTSLLAQVDSSVGGKVAVNLESAKNIVGAFHQPVAVIIDPLTLKTLPDREFREGLAEVIKYGIIWDGDFFNWLEENVMTLRQGGESLIYAIKKSCAIKASVVTLDERDEGTRMILNYGHTVGHALESLVGYGVLLHGEAVAAGMIIEAGIALEIGLLERQDYERIERILRRVVPVEIPGCVETGGLIEAMACDKKNKGGRLAFALPEKLGRAGVYYDVPEREILYKILDHFLKKSTVP
ncbi:3-dehydroquinate synthase [Thermosediminibacter litoriperuensis]|uniref:3-dehydroquinate synthase n=1 Tax=Thermosediminibacter litoriperuensis TaxID=291989 RepID=A0A5S5ASK6_9FIRM|nr:3-dehydroquinate synthase [Thermosediminibacter litoriperuensis]TYP54189.1 3-dehydroquinate synthase [Thermosediminibacter litoriperuensis]